MKVCAITMVYRDHWALSQWYAHHARHLGSAHLYIVAHGRDERIATLCPGANVITVPRDDLAGFDRRRGDLLNSLQDGLGVIYDWVIRTDVDELICFDPERYADIDDLFRQHNQHRALFALGADLVEMADDAELADNDAVLAGRRHIAFSGHYSKAVAVKRGTHMLRHGVAGKDAALFEMPRGLYLLHLKYANLAALAEANRHRSKIASGPETGLPGRAWRDAEATAKRFLSSFEALPKADWSEAEESAFEAISAAPETEADRGVVRARSLTMAQRTELPPWFKTS